MTLLPSFHHLPSARRRSALAAATALSLALLLPALSIPARAATNDAAQASAKMPLVKLQTSAGDIVLQLDARKAPSTVENFLRYVKEGHYNGTIFHRVIDGFMIQGGGFDADMKERPTHTPIKLEADNGLRNVRGSIAMARTSNPHSATAQFFINVVDNANLDAPRPDGYGYTVFGRVIEGMDVVDRIRSVATINRGPYRNVPQSPITINQAIIEKGQP